MLYACNFALIGLHEAAAATGDPFYAEAEEKLARFLCRIQVRSPAQPQLDGAWYRAFNFRNWQYWAANADWEWGPWCTETGWTQPWIAGTLALRQMKTSLWDLTKDVAIGPAFQKHRTEMLPDDVLATGGTPSAAKGVIISAWPGPPPRPPPARHRAGGPIARWCSYPISAVAPTASAAILAYSGFNSMPMNRRPFSLAMRQVVPLPANGSSTRSPGLLQASMIGSTRRSGNVA